MRRRRRALSAEPADTRVIACPSCKRRIFTRHDMVSTTMGGTAQCRVCGRTARLDLLSRWLLSCAIALILSSVLLYGGVFYSGHLFLISIFVIFGMWAFLCWLAFPFLMLEAASDSAPLSIRQSLFIAGVILVAAGAFDSFLASRFEADDGQERAGSARTTLHDR